MQGMVYSENPKGKTRLFFPKEFFRGEFRCGFFVSSMMKKYWAAELEILAEIDRICQKYDITYFADSGTLLGAVRHKGFIPWDDDVDIAMRREDYNRFISVCSGELDAKYSFVHAFNDKKFTQPHSCILENIDIKLQKKSYEEYHGCPYGTGVDIFPLDGLAPDPDEAEIQIELTAIISNVCGMLMEDLSEDEKKYIELRLKRIEDIMDCTVDRSKNIPKQLGMLYEQVCQAYTGEAERLTTFPLPYGMSSWIFEKEWYQDTVLLDFESFKIPCPSEYHKILTAGYGEYQRFEKNTAMHQYPVYSGFIKQINDIKIKNLKKILPEELGEFFEISSDQIKIEDVLKLGWKNTTVSFVIEGKKYAFRIPNMQKGSLANYSLEHKVYNKLEKLMITDDLVYYAEENGNKISHFIVNTNPLDVSDKGKVKECFMVLSCVHGLETEKKPTFDLWEIIEHYEGLWTDCSFYPDYDELKRKIRECYEYTLKSPKVLGITHFDLSGDNFLIQEMENGETDIRIIDWEYAGIQDTHLDIAMFALLAHYSKEDLDWLVDYYFADQCSPEMRRKIYAYMAVCGLLLSNFYETLDRGGRDMTQDESEFFYEAERYYDIFRFFEMIT